jgi:hypothetical protein
MIIFTFLNFAERKKDSHLSLEMAPSLFILSAKMQIVVYLVNEWPGKSSKMKMT